MSTTANVASVQFLCYTEVMTTNQTITLINTENQSQKLTFPTNDERVVRFRDLGWKTADELLAERQQAAAVKPGMTFVVDDSFSAAGTGFGFWK